MSAWADAVLRRLGRRRRSRVLAVIPARWDSSRFPGKPLALIDGKPMIQHTWDQTRQAASLSRVVVATDDERIHAACVAFGAEVVMTPADCCNGTERCAAALAALGGAAAFDVVINVQGDEPLTQPAHVDAVVRALQAAPPDCVYSTAATPMTRAEDVACRSRVKVVIDTAGNALYFSRAAIPGGHCEAPSAGGAYLLHLGLQCYDAAFLALFPSLPPTPLQLAEDLEQLKALEHGYKLRVVMVHDGDEACAGGELLLAHGVDEPADVARVEAALAARRTRQASNAP